MNVYSISFVKKVLKNYGVFPSKKLGQNFLICKNIAQKTVEETEIKTGDLILEPGPGLGALTNFLKENHCQILGVEKDKRLFSFLKESFSKNKNIKLFCEDILDFLESFSEKNYKVVATLPYPIVSYFLRKIFPKENKPSLMVLVVQKEVGEKICATPPSMNLISTMVQLYSQPKIIRKVPASCFWPQPKVDSVILKITNISSRFSREEEEFFFKVLKTGFAKKRKLLKNNLSEGLNIPSQKIEIFLKKLSFSKNTRAENLSVKQWLKLAEKLKNFTS